MAYTTIDDPSAYFKVQLYTGNGSANHAITFDDTDTDMQPDVVWIKNRDAADSHCFFDAVRGATKLMSPDAKVAETTDTDTLDSFTSDGFQVDADDKVNTNTEDYVAWCWKANGTGSSNTDGSINTTATSANTTSKFSINKYTGTGSSATVGHGLGVAPQMVIAKNTETDTDWQVYHDGLDPAAPGTDYIRLTQGNATADGDAYWDDTATTSTVFSVKDAGESNGSSQVIMAYCFADVQGFSKFGRYIGNGNANGVYVHLGFRPAWLMTKRADTGGAGYGWRIRDNKRDAFNPAQIRLYADTTEADQTNDNDIDWLANGFKLKETGAGENADGGTYIYAAFAEAPFVNSNGVPCNAR